MWEEAETQLKRALWIAQIKTHENTWRARIALGRGQYEEVLRLAQSAAEKEAGLLPMLAAAYARLGRQEEALQAASEARKHRAEGAERALGDVYAASDDLDRALFWYERSLRRRDYAATMRVIGTTLMALGDYREASAALERAVRYCPYIAEEDLALLGECLRKAGRERAANEVENLANALPYRCSAVS
jgi:tetratricopeptide (TPR) repeat protein